MSYVAPNPEAFLGEVVGDGQWFAYVKAAAGCPATAKWINGALVKGASLARGTDIATFQNHSYGNFTDGRSHAAIYLSQDAAGLTVIDQWKNQVAHQRVVRFKGGTVSAVNDGDAFAVIEDKVVLNRANRIRTQKILKPSAKPTSNKDKKVRIK